jgi:hypothetical protein
VLVRDRDRDRARLRPEIREDVFRIGNEVRASECLSW